MADLESANRPPPGFQTSAIGFDSSAAEYCVQGRKKFVKLPSTEATYVFDDDRLAQGV